MIEENIDALTFAGIAHPDLCDDKLTLVLSLVAAMID